MSASSYQNHSRRLSGACALDDLTKHSLRCQYLPAIPAPALVCTLGERQTVWDYLELCKQFWKVDQLNAWQQQVKDGVLPQFGANLKYGD